jgi:hypothetical protein
MRSTAISLIFFINGFTKVKVALHQNTDFRTIGPAQFRSTALSDLVGMYLAFSGFGVWHIVVSIAAVLYALALWPPLHTLRRGRLRISR